jgi:Trypsin-like peptidase domain
MEHTGEVRPREVIVPIFGSDANGNPQQFLGCGSIVGDGSILLTVDHVIRPRLPGPFAMVVMLPTEMQAFRLEVIDRDPAHDLALLRIDEYRPKVPLPLLFDRQVSCNTDLITLEYSTTRVEEDPSTKKTITILNPAVRMGHMTRHVDIERMGAAGQQALELSFPALEGASGAPVMYESTPFVAVEERWGVVGVLVSNVGYEAIPAKIVTELYEDNSTLQEIKYMLPQGLAVNINHLRPMYERAMAT